MVVTGHVVRVATLLVFEVTLALWLLTKGVAAADTVNVKELMTNLVPTGER
jgi:hypothetical protein